MKKWFMTVIVLVTMLQVNAQNLKLSNVLQVKLRNNGEIMSDDNQVKGYYYFYNVDKADKGNYNYILRITDENLREIKSIDIVKSKTAFLIEAEFNGDAFMFLFYNHKEKSIELISYDKTLKQIGNVKKKITTGYSSRYFNSVVMGMDPGHQFLVAVPNKGFLYYGFVEEKKYQYAVDYYDNNLKSLWHFSAQPDSKDMAVAEDAFQSSQYVGSLITRKKGLMSKDANYDILVTDIASGKELFKKEITDPGYNLSASKIVFDEANNNIMVFGEYFDLKDKEYNSASLGYFYQILDLKGNISQKKFVSFAKDISKVVPVDKSGKFAKGGRVFVHEIIHTSDGEIFVVGEQYRKAASAAGIAMAVLAGGRSRTATVQMEVLDMVILQFSPDLNIKKVHIFEKDITTFLLPAGSEWLSPKMLAYYARSYGWFDYSYYQMFKDKNSFVVTYVNYDKEKGEKAKNVLGTIVYTPEKVFTVDKMPLSRKSTDYMVRKAKSGYIMVGEYFKKEKNLDVRLEKINY